MAPISQYCYQSLVSTSRKEKTAEFFFPPLLPQNKFHVLLFITYVFIVLCLTIHQGHGGLRLTRSRAATFRFQAPDSNNITAFASIYLHIDRIERGVFLTSGTFEPLGSRGFCGLLFRDGRELPVGQTRCTYFMTALMRKHGETRGAPLLFGGEARHVAVEVFEADGTAEEIRVIHFQRATAFDRLVGRMGVSYERIC